MPNQFDVVGGAVELTSIRGNEVAIDEGLVVLANADANYTVLASEFKCKTIKVTGALTGTRNITLPTTAGAIFAVHNACTGGSLLFKTSAGTGPTVAAGKTAWIYCDGTDFVQVGAALP